MNPPKHSYAPIPSDPLSKVTSSCINNQQRQRNCLLMSFLLIQVSVNLISHPLEKPSDYPFTFEFYKGSTYFLLVLGFLHLFLYFFDYSERAGRFLPSLQLSGCASLAILFMLRSFLQFPGEFLFRSFLIFLVMVAVVFGVPLLFSSSKFSRSKN